MKNFLICDKFEHFNPHSLVDSDIYVHWQVMNVVLKEALVCTQ